MPFLEIEICHGPGCPPTDIKERNQEDRSEAYVVTGCDKFMRFRDY